MVASQDYSRFERIFSALVSPMRADESIDFATLSKLVEFQLGRGVEGFYCCGSSGEGLLLSLDERTEIVRTVVQTAAGRAPVIAHVGTIRTADAIALAKDAEAAGADAVSLIPPYYYRFTAEEILGYYNRVMEATSLPVIIYNIPQFTQVQFDKTLAGPLLDQEQVLGVKHTAHDLYSLERMTAAYPEKVFFNGFDEIYLSSLAAGARATIGTTVNVQPELFLRTRALFETGDLPGARLVQEQINNTVEELVSQGVFRAAKYLAGDGVLDCGDLREPFKPLNDVQRKELDRLLAGIHEAAAQL
ncbi:dihydrodipicolinate synthase family protein [Arthrobacter sp. Sa2BUA2]|uniref:Dihydrodipicolinate synthase family protein n=1 Tax=Arthrobacter pullicola TaxID=2762224 RepID=A0ABR8YMC7_9MICC|nr:dihydrodipicolinate synthase family protein [Arthrobacter pullicola]MBD8045282.1 dihydrodipicolinate synthase family protein [Arthrobacter pullicola]